MLIPNPEILLAQIITFVLGMSAIWFIYLKPLGSHLRERKSGIQKDLEAAALARAEAERLKTEFAAEKQRLMEENRRMMEKSKADAEAFRLELMAKAKAEHEALLKAGRTQLKQEQAEAIREIREASAALIVQATEKLLHKNLNKSTQGALAKKFIKELKPSRN